MLNSIRGHYNGRQIVLDEAVELAENQAVIVTILDLTTPVQKKPLDFSKYISRGASLWDTDAQDYVNRSRADERY